jgi:hypothetical protein
VIRAEKRIAGSFSSLALFGAPRLAFHSADPPRQTFDPAVNNAKL